jgi:mono/diheme cytochrome c family protein
MRSLVTAMLLSTLPLTAACVATRDGERSVGVLGSEVTISGHDEFLRACASCHGVGGRGDGPVAAALRPPPPDLTSLAARAGGRFPRERVIAVLSGDVALSAHGSRRMPVWSARFAPSDFAATAAASIYARRWIEALASHVGSIQRPGIDVDERPAR